MPSSECNCIFRINNKGPLTSKHVCTKSGSKVCSNFVAHDAWRMPLILYPFQQYFCHSIAGDNKRLSAMVTPFMIVRSRGTKLGLLDQQPIFKPYCTQNSQNSIEFWQV